MTAFGLLWSMVTPLLLIIVYNFVFGHLLRGGPANFAYFLMVGILLWNFFAQSLMMSTGSILDNGNLIRKVALPMEIFPVATVLFNCAQVLFALVVFFPMAFLFFKVPVAFSWINFLPVLTLQIFFTLGTCFMFSTANVFYRDVRHFTVILLIMLFWITPIIYNVQTVPASLRTAINMNPMTYFILAYQDALYRNTFLPPDRLMVIHSLTLL